MKFDMSFRNALVDLLINGYISQTITLADIIPGTKVQSTWVMTLSFYDLDLIGQGRISQTWRCLRSLSASCIFIAVWSESA